MTSRNDQTTRPRFELSLSQTIGGSLAAATAAVLGSRLGLVGTISGAAVASVVSTVAAAVYTTSLRHTRARLLTGLSVPSRKATAKIALGAATVFAVAATAVTGLELASGRSLTGAAGATSVGQAVQHGSSTTPVRTGRTSDPSSPKTPSASPSAEPSASPSATPSTAPSASLSATPTSTPSSSPPSTPAPSVSATPSGSAASPSPTPVTP